MFGAATAGRRQFWHDLLHMLHLNMNKSHSLSRQFRNRPCVHCHRPARILHLSGPLDRDSEDALDASERRAPTNLCIEGERSSADPSSPMHSQVQTYLRSVPQEVLLCVALRCANLSCCKSSLFSLAFSCKRSMGETAQATSNDPRTPMALSDVCVSESQSVYGDSVVTTPARTNSLAESKAGFAASAVCVHHMSTAAFAYANSCVLCVRPLIYMVPQPIERSGRCLRARPGRPALLPPTILEQ